MKPTFLVRVVIESIEIDTDLINKVREYFPQEWTNEEFLEHLENNIQNTELLYLIEDIKGWNLNDIEYSLVKENNSKNSYKNWNASWTN